MSIRILIAEDHKIIREGLRSLLEKQVNVEVIGEAENGNKAVQMAQEMSPDVVIMDITMPELNGIEATRQIMDKCHDVKVIGLSVHPDRQFVEGMLKAGASGYLLKDCAFDDVVTAVRVAAANQTYLSPKVARFVVEGFLGHSLRKGTAAFGVLTTREREVLQLLAEGRTKHEIGDKLCVSPRTVETHRRRIMEKLGVKSIAELVRFAIREGLTPL
ncbi:MAG: response regulator transcription factor [Deltaproteobacteria bacterium]|nr:response regulator transcription factor [Deltaproteobacteria bacterium]